MSALGTYLSMLFGLEEPGALAELRWRLAGGGMGQVFHDCHDRGR